MKQGWDPIRRKVVADTPEERVRQAFVSFLVEQAGCPAHAIQIEFGIERGRFDVAVSAPDGSLWLLAECKAREIHTPQSWLQAWTQLRRYSRSMSLPKYFAIVGGPRVWCWEVQSGQLLADFPHYPEKGTTSFRVV